MNTYLSLSSVIRGGCHAPVSPLFPPHTHTQWSLGGRLILILRGAPEASIGAQKKVGGGKSRSGGGRRSRPVAGRRPWRLEGPSGMSLILMFEIWARNLYVLVLLLCVCASECVFACVLIPYSPPPSFCRTKLKRNTRKPHFVGRPGRHQRR